MPDPPGGGPFSISDAFQSPTIQFLELPPGRVSDWHNAPFTLMGVVLAGRLEAETSDGATRQWTATDLYVANDLTGKGHTSHVVDGPVQRLSIELPDDVDVSAWRA